MDTLELNYRTSSYITSITDLRNQTLGNGAFSEQALSNCIADADSLCFEPDYGSKRTVEEKVLQPK